jgi:crotonobetaine/carnitine-CoA ligase
MTSEVRALPPAQRTLPAMLQRQAAQFGARPLLRIAGRQWTHGDAAEAAAVRAGALAQAGVARGDRIAVMCGNRIEFLETFLGAGWMGASVVPINTASMGPQIEYFLANSAAKLLVIEAGFLERLKTADLGRTALRDMWVVGETLHRGSHLQACASCTIPKARMPFAPAAVQPGDPLAILYTSGTTGAPKGVICPHAQYVWWGVNSAECSASGADDVLCTTLPLFHINALNTFAQAALTGCRGGVRAALLGVGLLAVDARERPTVVYLLGAMVPILLAQPEGPKASGITACASGSGRACRRRRGRRSRRARACRCSKATARRKPTSRSPPRPDSPRGRQSWAWLRKASRPAWPMRTIVALPPGEAGELLLRADEPHAFASGYFNMPQKTVEAWRNLWFHTGDRVVRDADGAFRFVDRIKDAIRRRGENISSFEVEQVLLSHAAVAACAVYPVRSELAEDEVMAALVARGLHVRPAVDLALLRGPPALLRGAALHRRVGRPAAHRERQGAEVQAA